jgi:hypothetical protein
MAGALLVDMSLPVSDGAVIATISAKRDGKNRATEKTSLIQMRETEAWLHGSCGSGVSSRGAGNPGANDHARLAHRPEALLEFAERSLDGRRCWLRSASCRWWAASPTHPVLLGARPRGGGDQAIRRSGDQVEGGLDGVELGHHAAAPLVLGGEWRVRGDRARDQPADLGRLSWITPTSYACRTSPSAVNW